MLFLPIRRKKKIILIDNGHGIDTPGKRSPDGALLEYAWNREIAARIVAALTALGHDAQLLVPELEDISLAERCRRVGEICRRIGKDNYEAAKLHLPGQNLRTDYTDGDPDLEADFYILRHTQPASVLMENFFMDSRRDCQFLLSDEGKQAIVDLHVDGICRYMALK